jgi:hypothetical protein
MPNTTENIDITWYRVFLYSLYDCYEIFEGLEI